MRFFTVTAKVKAPSIEKVETLTNGGKILSKTTDQLNRKDPTKFCFVYDWDKAGEIISFGVITRNNDEPNNLVTDFAVALDLHLGDLHVTEIAMNYFALIFECAEHRTYVDERMQILARFDISTVACPHHPSEAEYRYREFVIDGGRTKEDIIDSYKEGADIIHQLFEHKAVTCQMIAVVKPQNYGVDLQLREQVAAKAFAESLWHGGYIKAKRYVEMRLFSANEHGEDMAKEICLSSNDGLVVLDIRPLEEEMKTAKSKKSRDKIERSFEFVKSLITGFNKTLIFVIVCTRAQFEKFKQAEQKEH